MHEIRRKQGIVQQQRIAAIKERKTSLQKEHMLVAAKSASKLSQEIRIKNV